MPPWVSKAAFIDFATTDCKFEVIDECLLLLPLTTAGVVITEEHELVIFFVNDMIGVAIYTVFTCVVPGTTVVTAIILKPVASGMDDLELGALGKCGRCGDVVGGKVVVVLGVCEVAGDRELKESTLCEEGGVLALEGTTTTGCFW